MKIAVLSDIHGNLPALNAVLADARANGAERFVFAGDYIFDLPWPNEITKTIRGIPDAAVVAGNKEGYLRNYREGAWACQQLGAMEQTVRELTPENWDYLRSLPASASLALPSGRKIFAAHWFPGFLTGGKQTAISSRMFREASENPAFDRDAFLNHLHDFLSNAYVADTLAGVDADVAVFGHTHLQWHGTVGDKLLLNPGSCGQPLGGDNRAAYALLTDTPDGIAVEERRVPYDMEAVIREAKQSAMYRCGAIYMELVFAAMRSGFDTFAPFFALAEEIANERGQSGMPYSDEVWELTYKEARAVEDERRAFLRHREGHAHVHTP